MSGVKLRDGWGNVALSQFDSRFKRCTLTYVPEIWGLLY